MAKFTDIFEDVTKQGTKIPTNLYLETGMYPIIDQGQSQVAGYTNETEGVFTDIPAIIFGDHTRIIKYVDAPCFLGADGVKLLKAKDPTANYKYLYYALCNADIPNTGYNRHFKWLKEIEIPEYSTEEQNSVVSQLETIDVLISLRKQQLSKLDELVKSRFIELFGDPEHNEKKWAVLKLEALCSVSSSKRIYQNELDMDGVPFLRISDLVNRMDTGSTECELHIPEERYEELKSLGLVPVAGDVLLTARGTLGRCYTIAESDRFYFQDGMITWLYDFNKSLTTNYLTHLFAMSGFRKQIDSLQAGSTVAYLSISMTKKLDVMLPPLDLQEQFAAFVEQTDKSKLAIQKSLEKLETLKKALMQQYFG